MNGNSIGAISGQRAALYLRLSKEDGAAESASISNQRRLLQAYVVEHGFAVKGEYVDDGYSGTNFDRPAFSRMLRDIEAGEIDVVLTKDLSRLGRDYILAGQFTEQYFPSKGIRYIAVNDGYDSAESDSDIVPFKNILNEMYARDISKKIRSAFRAKMLDGKYIAAFAPYGYQKDPANHGKLCIDPKTAPVVQSIFRSAAAGASPAEIAAGLCTDRIPTPLTYRSIAKHDREAAAKFSTWSVGTIIKMLHNAVYCGHSIQGKTTKLSFKSHKTVPIAPDRQIVVRNTHPPLIDEDTFALVQRRLAARIRRQTGRFRNRFSGVVFCADCGKAMSSAGTRRKDSPAVLTCGTYKFHGKSRCSNHFIDYRVLEHIICSILSEYLHTLQDDHVFLSAQDSKKNASSVHNIRFCMLQERWNTVNTILSNIYEDAMRGKITDSQRDHLLRRYHLEAEQLETELHAYTHNDSPTDYKKANLGLAFGAVSEAISTLEKITPDHPAYDRLLFLLLDRIEIGQGSYKTDKQERIRHQNITVHLRFHAEPTVREFCF